jgi:hypothetical protein
MRKVRIIKEYDGWNEQCIYCGKIIEGYTPKQVNQLMSVHLTNCKIRKEKEKIKDDSY